MLLCLSSLSLTAILKPVHTGLVWVLFQLANPAKENATNTDKSRRVVKPIIIELVLPSIKAHLISKSKAATKLKEVEDAQVSKKSPLHNLLTRPRI